MWPLLADREGSIRRCLNGRRGAEITLLDVVQQRSDAASALVRIHRARISLSVHFVSNAKPVADQTASRRDPCGTWKRIADRA